MRTTLAAAGLDDIAADDGVGGPIGALDQHVGSQRRDHVVRRVFVKGQNDGVDAFQGRETPARSASG